MARPRWSGAKSRNLFQIDLAATYSRLRFRPLCGLTIEMTETHFFYNRWYYLSVTSKNRAIEKFLEDYRTFGLDKGFPDHMEKYQEYREEKVSY